MNSAPKTYKFYDLEKKVYSFREHYSLKEFTIVLNALFRMKSKLQYPPLIQDLLVKSIREFPTLDDTMLITICKVSYKLNYNP